MGCIKLYGMVGAQANLDRASSDAASVFVCFEARAAASSLLPSHLLKPKPQIHSHKKPSSPNTPTRIARLTPRPLNLNRPRPLDP